MNKSDKEENKTIIVKQNTNEDNNSNNTNNNKQITHNSSQISRKRIDIRDPLNLFENINIKLQKQIITASENKKNYVYQFLLNCYEIMKEVEGKIEQEKISLELLLDEKIQKEKFRYKLEKESNIY